MLSISPLGAGADAIGMAEYLEDAAEKANNATSQREDYYSADGDAGQWYGAGAARLGLSGDLQPGQLLAMYQGFDPTTGEALVKNAGEKHKAGWDLTFSVPKSLSAVWAVAAPDERKKIETIVRNNANRSLDFLADKAFTSRDRSDKAAAYVPGLTAATYIHGTSREQEPQLHIHCEVANLGMRADGSHCALDFDTRWKMAAGAHFRAGLADDIQRELGLSIERDADSFKVAGVPEDLCTAWSTRAAQIREAMAEGGYTSAKAASVAALQTRQAKADVSANQLFDSWAAEAATHGFSADVIEQLRAEEAERRAQPAEPLDPETDPLSTKNLLAGLTENDSAFTIHKIYQAVAVAAQGRLDQAGIEQRVTELLQERDLLKLTAKAKADTEVDARNPRANELKFTTREHWLLENALAERGLRLAGDKSMTLTTDKADAAIAQFEAAKGFQLAAEQRAALRYIVAETGQLALVRGAAGAGKTTMLEAAKIAWEGEGYRVRGAALAGKAAAGLQSAGIESDTIARLLMAEQRLEKSAEWLEKMQSSYDEMRSKVDRIPEDKRTEKLLSWEAKSTEMLDKAKADHDTAKAALIRKGDVLVIDEAGMVGSRDMAALAKKCDEAGAKLVLVGDEKQLQAIAAGGAFKMLAGRQGFAELVDNRRQKSAEDRAVATATVEGNAADALISMLSRDKMHVSENRESAIKELAAAWLADPREVANKLIMTSTRAGARELNDTVRAGRLEAGLLINNQQVQTDAGKLNFAEGDRLIFLKNDRNLGVKNGHLGEIKRIEMSTLGQVITVYADDLKKDVRFVVGDPTDKEFAKEAKAQGLAVYNKFDHGYAVTTHKSQGVTVDAAYALGLGDREMSYVTLTRHRHDCQVFIDAKALEKAIAEAEADAADHPATEGMLRAMKKVSEKYEIEPVPEELQNFKTVREWLDLNSGTELGFDQDRGKKDDLADVPEELREQMLRLKEACKAMSASHQKDTTLDYDFAADEAPKLGNEATNAAGEQQQAPQLRGQKLVDFGEAPYLHEDGARRSYFVTTVDDNGREKTVWGVDLQRAISDADAQRGDYIELESLGKKKLVVMEEIEIDGKKVEQPKEVEKNLWRAEVIPEDERQQPRQPGQEHQQPAQPAPTPAPTEAPLRGRRLVDHGEAPYRHNPDAKPSYFVTTADERGNEKTVWGVDLARAIADSDAQRGDFIELESLGKKKVTVMEEVEIDGKKVEQPKEVEKNLWRAEIVPEEERQQQPKQPEQLHQETAEAEADGIENTLADSLTVEDAQTIEQEQVIEIVI